MPRRSLLERGECDHGHRITGENIICISGNPRCPVCYSETQKKQQKDRKRERLQNRVTNGDATFLDGLLSEAEREKKRAEIIARSPAAQKMIAQRRYEAFLNEKINPSDPNSITFRELEAVEVHSAADPIPKQSEGA